MSGPRIRCGTPETGALEADALVGLGAWLGCYPPTYTTPLAASVLEGERGWYWPQCPVEIFRSWYGCNITDEHRLAAVLESGGE